MFAVESPLESIGLSPAVVTQLTQKMQVTQLTHIQSRAIPAVLSGRDVMIQSATGSGKTLAYVLPIAQVP